MTSTSSSDPSFINAFASFQSCTQCQGVSLGNDGASGPVMPVQNGSELPTCSFAARKKRRRIVYNCCLACNETFTDHPGPEEEGMKLLRNLARIMLTNAAEVDFTVERNPVCSKCKENLAQYLELQNKIEMIRRMMSALRKLIGKKFVDSYDRTVPTRKNYDVKRRIVEVWKPRVNPILNSIQDKTIPENQGNESDSSSVDVSSNNYAGMTTDPPLPASTLAEECPSPEPASPLHCPSVADDDNEPFEGLVSLDSSIVNQDIDQTTPSLLAGIPTDSESTGKKLDRRRNRPIVVTSNRCHGCKYCGKLFPSNFSLEMHERIHTGERPFKCSVCGKGCVSKGELKKHKITHDGSRFAGDPKFECDLCGRKYHLEQSLYMHKRAHKGLDRFKSANPGDPNAPLRVVRKYVRKVIPRDENGIPIPEGPKVPKKRGPPPKKPKFFGPRRLKRKREPGQPLEYKCETCGKAFPRPYKLQEHMNTHTGDTPHKCSECDMSFKSHSALCRHRYTHEPNLFEKEPQNVCEVCGKKFYLPHHLSQHRWRWHSGKTKIPKGLYNPRTDLSANSEGLWTCTKCPEDNRPKYQHKRGLVRHLDQAHPNEDDSSPKKERKKPSKSRPRKSQSDNDELGGNSDSGEDPPQNIQKRSKRMTCRKTDYKKMLEDTDEIDMPLEQVYTGTGTGTITASKLTPSYIRHLLGDRDVQLILTRVDRSDCQQQNPALVKNEIGVREEDGRDSLCDNIETVSSFRTFSVFPVVANPLSKK